MKPGYNLRCLISLQTSRHRDLFFKDFLSLSSQWSSEALMVMIERSYLQRQILGCASPYLRSAISYPPREQHRIHHIPLFLRSTPLNQLVHGHVTWACGVTPNCPLKGLEDGVTLETLGMKQQGMVCLRHISSKNHAGASQSYFSRNSIAWRKPLAMRILSGDHP